MNGRGAQIPMRASRWEVVLILTELDAALVGLPYLFPPAPIFSFVSGYNYRRPGCIDVGAQDSILMDLTEAHKV